MIELQLVTKIFEVHRFDFKSFENETTLLYAVFKRETSIAVQVNLIILIFNSSIF